MKVSNMCGKDNVIRFHNKESGSSGKDNNGVRADKQKSENASTSKNLDTIFAGDLNLIQNDVLLKKAEANKNAVKTLLGAFISDNEVEDVLAEKRKQLTGLQAELQYTQEQLGNIKKQKKNLKDAFDITDGSQEQMDLELLEKQRRIEKGSHETLTVEEKKAIETMAPLTEYQVAALQYDGMSDYWTEKLENTRDKVIEYNRTISAIQQERLKSREMIDAKRKAEDIRENASQEIIGLLQTEVKDKVDEQTDEIKDTIEEKETEKYEEEKEQKAHENNEISTDINQAEIHHLQYADSALKRLQSEIKVMIGNQKILIEDAKGVEIDQEL